MVKQTTSYMGQNSLCHLMRTPKTRTHIVVVMMHKSDAIVARQTIVSVHPLCVLQQTQTERELECDPMHQTCQTPSYVYEDECSLCKGTGQMKSNHKGRHRLYSCTLCSGLGYVRRTTSRFIPNVNGTGPKMTLGRPKPQEELPPHLQNGHLRSGFKRKD
ncbi:unnamed protein product [Ostreobium quekettii]|uniref:Uncharacterized protein n=1 Tax=Ostreobium quekettii TaxID=121088 RepID=A0A8S1J2M8_9CHLO|nr:unnamed protein product [Ostreobium quekettii]|eukprot:evm.model.scf_985EXC.2 EVM.evm.TU.scf_985EXC.2   scf_985EXC:14897-16698(+)